MELALANELCEKRNNVLSVKIKLDGLNVRAQLDFRQNYSLCIASSDTTDILYSEEAPGEIVGPEQIATAILKMVDTLKKLVYFKPLGKFILKENKSELLIYEVFKEFFSTEACCICMEETNVLTECDHHCCHKCLEKIKVCPICRRDLYD
jgi:hypothetical protein